MAGKDGPITPIGIIGVAGRNGSDAPLLIPDAQCREAMNVDWHRSSLGRKRGGSENLSLASSGTPFVGGSLAMGRFVPGDDQTAQELWAIDGARVFHRLAGSVIWADVTPADACTGFPQETNFLTFNGKLYIAYKSAVNRLHVWDGTSFRRVGIAKAGAIPSVVLAAGTITDTRTYRVAFIKQSGGVTVLRGELSDATVQQVMAVQQATVTRPAPPGEGETHWELWAASSTSSFGDYRLQATTVIATATAVDNAPLGPIVGPDDGTNTCPPSCKYLASDDARVIMAGAYETVAGGAAFPKNNRVWWTPTLGDSDIGDDERILITGTFNGFADVEEAITGLSQPMQVVTSGSTSLERGSFYVFSFLSQWKFISTGNADSPYLRFRITGGSGAVHHKSITTALDANGNPAVYWWSPMTGPFRISSNGQEFIGEDLIDIIPDVNIDATIPVHTVYHPEIRQVWFHVAIGTSMYPNLRLIFDTQLGRFSDMTGVRGGWAVHDGEAANAYCSVLFSASVGATMGRKLKPYIGQTSSTAIWKCDTTALDDVGTPYKAFIDSKSYAPWGLGKKGGTSLEPLLVAEPSGGVTIQMITYRDEGAEENPSTADLTDHSDSGEAERVFVKFAAAKLGDSFTFSCRIGDAQPISNTWALDALIVTTNYQGE